MFSYSAYGLDIESEIRLQELTPVPDLVQPEQAGLGASKFSTNIQDSATLNLKVKDVLIHLGKDRSVHNVLQNGSPHLDVGKTQAVLSSPSVGYFIISNGREIIVYPSPDANDKLIRRFLIGTVMAILLYQRGILALHASSVKIHQKAVAFLGESGSGKSSIAAALQALGHEILSDDVTPLRITPDCIEALPGYPQLKVSQEVAYALGIEPDALYSLYEGESKRGYSVAHRFFNAPVNLDRLYVLTTRHQPEMVQLNAQAAFVELLHHSYPTRLAQPGGVTHFENCADLVKRIPVFRLNRAQSVSSILELAKTIEAACAA